MSTRTAARLGTAGLRPAPAPTESSLREAALRHLARYGCTTVLLTRVLDRRVERWARTLPPDHDTEAVHAARAMVRAVVARLAEQKLVDDAAFAASRARTLLRAGRSRLAVGAHLASRGIGKELVREAVPEDPEAELAGALMLLRRRRLGAFAAAPPSPDLRLRALAILARAGFGHGIASTALRMEQPEALALIDASRRS